jgi:hypothetical protein
MSHTIKKIKLRGKQFDQQINPTVQVPTDAVAMSLNKIINDITMSSNPKTEGQSTEPIQVDPSITPVIDNLQQITPPSQPINIPQLPPQPPPQVPPPQKPLPQNPPSNLPLTPPDTPENEPCIKEIIDNSDITDFLTSTLGNDPEIECNEIYDNNLSSSESARFKITTKTNKDIRGFFYSIKSEDNFVQTSHIETINHNQVNLIINNLSKKSVDFSLCYIALF